MLRLLTAAILLLPVAAQAQDRNAAPVRQMPAYDDGEPPAPPGYGETYGTADTHHVVDQTPRAPYAGAAYGYGAYGYGFMPHRGDSGAQGQARDTGQTEGGPND